MTKNVTPILTNISQHNLKFIDKVEITMFNPTTVSNNSYFRKYIYEAIVWFKKDDMTLYKKFENNDHNLLTSDINNFIKNDIKI